MPSNPRITRAGIIELLNKGHRLTEIAEMYGTSRQNLNWHLYHSTNQDDVRLPMRIAQESIPWKNVEPLHRKAAPYQRAFNHAEFVATGGHGMSAFKLRRLRRWYEMLAKTDTVVRYDPSIGPYPGMTKGGWDYPKRDRRPVSEGGDGDLILRVNEFVQMSDEAYRIWRLPEPDEWPDDGE